MPTLFEFGQFDPSSLELKVKQITNEFGIRRNNYDEELGDYDFFLHRRSGSVSDEEDNASAGEDSDYEDEWEPWLKVYYIEIVTKAEGKKVGRFGVRIVGRAARSLVGGDNLPYRLIVSERGGSDLESFGTALFDKANQGRLRREFLYGPTMGTGAFGEELNSGSFAFISGDHQHARDSFLIKPEHRGRGIGSWALQELLRHPILWGIDFLFVEAAPTDVPYEQRSDLAFVEYKFARVVRFCHKAGFRRVGTGTYFGYSLRNPEHPSRWMAMEDNCDEQAGPVYY